jgi:hypothetical protein
MQDHVGLGNQPLERILSNCSQPPVSRITRDVGTMSHFGGYAVYQDLVLSRTKQ